MGTLVPWPPSHRSAFLDVALPWRQGAEHLTENCVLLSCTCLNSPGSCLDLKFPTDVDSNLSLHGTHG